jgi:uncharacterized protein (TIGR02246 family)
MNRAIFFLFSMVSSASLLAQSNEVDGEYWPLPEYRVFGEPATESDAEQIDDLMRRFGKAWGSGNVDELVDTFAPDAEFTNAFGVVLRGHDELRSFLTGMFERWDSEVSSGEQTSRGGISRRYLGSDTVVLHSYTESRRGENRDGSGARRVQVTIVLVKTDGNWKIAHQMIMDTRD